MLSIFFCLWFDVYREYGYIGRWQIFWVLNTTRSYSQRKREWRQLALWSTLLSAMTLPLSVTQSVSLAILRSHGTFTYMCVELKLMDMGGGEWKISINIYYYMCSHMHGRRTVTKLQQNLQGMSPIPWTSPVLQTHTVYNAIVGLVHSWQRQPPRASLPHLT